MGTKQPFASRKLGETFIEQVGGLIQEEKVYLLNVGNALENVLPPVFWQILLAEQQR